MILTCSKHVILYNLIIQYAGSVFISVRWSTLWISFFKCYVRIFCWKMHVISYSSPDYKLGIYWVGQGQLKTIPKELCTIKTFLALKFEHHSIHHWTSVTTVLVSQQEIELRKKLPSLILALTKWRHQYEQFFH